jgi:hypothetical protein
MVVVNGSEELQSEPMCRQPYGVVQTGDNHRNSVGDKSGKYDDRIECEWIYSVINGS